MKDYREMADSVRARSRAVLLEKKRKQKIWASVLVPCCLVVAAIALFGGGLFGETDNTPDTLPGGVLENPDTPPDTLTGDALENPDTPPDILTGDALENPDTPPDILTGDALENPDTLPDTRPVVGPDTSGETASDTASETTLPGYGSVDYLAATALTDTTVQGMAFQHTVLAYSPGGGESSSPPAFEFTFGYLHVVAQAVEEYAGVRETLNEYGSTTVRQYRLFRMRVLDPLESGMEGDFLYLLPADLKGDLTAYDALLISMTQLPHGYVLKCDGKLTAYDYLFTDPYGQPELGNIIAFSDGVFDESLWQDRSWLYGYQFAGFALDEGYLPVSRGSTLEEALARRHAWLEEWETFARTPTVKHVAYTIAEAQAAMAYIKPFDNGVFIPVINAHDYTVRRYINGCPTNEWLTIDRETEQVTTSGVRFDAADVESLPDISQYIAGLDLASILPLHTDPTGKVLMYRSAVGWYEKTEDGVYAIVRLSWRYYDQVEAYIEYYDETFILLDESGERVVSREELISLIGENDNIGYGEYGVGMDMPT